MSLLTHMERWKDIEGYEGLYMVSTCGRVKSLGNGNSNNSKERILKQGKDKYGYFRVVLCKNNVTKTFQVHRLVAKTFIPNPLNLPCVNHKNEGKQNFVSNLEWCSYQYNTTYGTAIKRKSEKLKNLSTISKKVICIESGLIYPSTMEAERITGVSHSNISKCCIGKQKTAGGFHWQFV